MIFQSLWLEFVNGAGQSGRRFVFADIEQLEITGQLGTRWLYVNVGHDDFDDDEYHNYEVLCKVCS